MSKVVRRIMILLVALSSMFLLTSCEDEEDLTIYEGYVVDKIFDEGYVYYTTIMAGKTPIRQMHRIPDKWYVIIYKDEKISKHRISKEYYNTLDVGSYISLQSQIIDENEGEE